VQREHQRRGHGRGTSLRRYLPVAYLAAAMIAAGLVLPSALRPPPDPANTSNALNPNAPPNQDNPDQILESLQEAGGAGAGAATSSTTTTLRSARQLVRVAPPITLPPAASLDYCYGNPPRQIPSVYAGPCVGAWQGNNGGSTSKNVSANEIRIGFDNAGAPDAGVVPPASSNNAGTSSTTVTWQVLTAYFNEHYQLYNRKVVFFGLTDPGSDTADDEAASAGTYADTDDLFAIYDEKQDVCEDFEQRGLVAFCDPLADAAYDDNRPGLFSAPVGSSDMDLNEMLDFGAEYACKVLKGKPAVFGGPGLTTEMRKIGFITFESADGGLPASVFTTAYSNQCGGTVVDNATMSSEADAETATEAMARFRADGITTVVFNNSVGNVVLAMEAASASGYTPEWVMLGNYAMDTNLLTEIEPTVQSAHEFGLSAMEWPQVPAATECYEAFHSIDPGAEPNSQTCLNDWITLVLIMDGIQAAGPDLTPATLQRGLFDVGYRFGQTVWSVGGGFGPGHYAYADSVAQVWFDPTAIDPTSGAPGAYMWTSARHQLGQLTADDSQLFKIGSPVAPET